MIQKSIFKGTDNWSMASVWNDSLGSGAERPMQERSRLWASELGKPNIELFLKMRGVEPSNPPNQRSKRKFAAGRLMEWIVQITLNRAGILKSKQDYLSHQYKGLLEVTGKLDFMAGGVPDYERWEQWEELMKKLEMPEDFFTVNKALREYFSTKYPEGFADTILEIKSCSSFAMNAMEKTKKSSKNHRMQNYHYLKATGTEQGRVVYICRDDLRMFEVPVKLSDKKVEAEYRGAIEEITEYYNKFSDIPLDKFIVMEEKKPVAYMPLEGMPPLEQNIVWDDDYCKFARNWGVEYSNYLTLLYGFTDQMMFEDAVMPSVVRWNRVMGRIKRADKMTDKNLLVIEEINKAGFDIKELVLKFAGDEEEEINNA
jgi:hypothetical protein